MTPTRIESLLRSWLDSAIDFLPRLVLILIILLLTRFLARRVSEAVTRICTRARAPHEISVLLSRSSWIGVMLGGSMLVLQQLGWDQAVLGIVASVGVIGIVVGFALQDIVRQFAAGTLLLMLRPFRVGEMIKVGAFEGRVVDIQLRVTVLRTAEGHEVQIPNADVYSTALTNISRYGEQRRALTLRLPRAASLEHSRATLAAAIASVPGVAEQPAPELVATVIEAEALVAELRFWVKTQTHEPDAVVTAAVTAIQAVLPALEATQAKG